MLAERQIPVYAELLKTLQGGLSRLKDLGPKYQGKFCTIQTTRAQTCKRASKDAKVLRGSDSSPHSAWQPTLLKVLPIQDAKRLTNVHSPSKVVKANRKWL